MGFKNRQYLKAFAISIFLLFPSISIGGKDSKVHQNILIGIAGNFSGGSDSTNNQWKKYIYPAAELALDGYLKKHPNPKYDISLIRLDYEGKKEFVPRTAKEALDHKVVAVVGYDQSEFAEIAAREFDKLKLPMITHTATADRITKDRPTIFRTCFTNSSAADYFAAFVRDKLRIDVVITLPESTCLYCTDLSGYFTDSFRKRMGLIVNFPSDVRGYFDWSTISTRVNDLERKGLRVAFFVPNHEDRSARVVRRILTDFKDPMVLGGDGWGDKGELFFKILGEREFEGYNYTHWTSSIRSNSSQKFVRDFKQKTGYTPVDSSALIFDALSIVLKAIENTSEVNHDSVKMAISNMGEFHGVTGVIPLSSGKLSAKRPLIQKVGSGRFSVLEGQL